MNAGFKTPKALWAPVLVAMSLGAPAALAQAPVVVERDGAEQVRAGERYEYQLKVRNRSDVPLKDVEINEFMPEGMKAKGEDGTDQDVLSESIPYLGAGESTTLKVSGIARQEGVVQSCMAIDYKPAVCTEIEVVKPDVRLDCRMEQPEYTAGLDQFDGDATTFYACDPVQVVCTVTNEGSGATRESRLMLNAPSVLAFGEGQANTDVAAIEPGDSEEFAFVLNAEQAGSYTLTPTLQTDDGVAEAMPMSFEVIQPQLELAVQAPSTEYVSRPVNYTVHLRNSSDVPVPDARLELDLPESLEHVSVSSETGENGDGDYEFGVLAPGASRMINVQGDAVEPGRAELTAAAEGYCVSRIERTGQVVLEGVPALVVIAYDEHDPVVVGEETTYDIKVKNQGTAEAKNIRIEAELGDQFRFVDGDGATEVTGNGTSIDLAPVDVLEPGETVSWSVRAKANAEGYARLNLNLTSSATKRSITEQEPTRVIR